MDRREGKLSTQQLWSGGVSSEMRKRNLMSLSGDVIARRDRQGPDEFANTL